MECRCGDIKYASYFVYSSYACCVLCAVSIISGIVHKFCKLKRKKYVLSQVDAESNIKTKANAKVELEDFD